MVAWGHVIFPGYLAAVRIYLTNFVKMAGAGAHPKGKPTAK